MIFLWLNTIEATGQELVNDSKSTFICHLKDAEVHFHSNQVPLCLLTLKILDGHFYLFTDLHCEHWMWQLVCWFGSFWVWTIRSVVGFLVQVILGLMSFLVQIALFYGWVQGLGYLDIA
jgi:hypothetical protein